MKNFGLNLLGGKNLKQTNIVYIVWLLVLSLMEMCNAKEQSEQEKNYLRRKGAPENATELSPVFKEINRLRNGTMRVLTSGQTGYSLCKRIK